MTDLPSIPKLAAARAAECATLSDKAKANCTKLREAIAKLEGDRAPQEQIAKAKTMLQVERDWMLASHHCGLSFGELKGRE
jgi:histidine ammonia-lyase